MRLMANLAGLALTLILSPAHATKMSGKVTLADAFFESLDDAETASSQASKAYYWKLPNGIIPVQPPAVDPASDIALVLYRGNGDESRPDNVKSVNVLTGKLAKTVVVTRPGSTIKFVSVSPFVHELYSPTLSSFAPEAQSKNAFRPIEFKAEGIYEIRCKRMPNFIGYVVVTAGKEIDVKPDGTFAGELEPGRYTLKVFHRGKWIHKQSFTAEGGKMDHLTISLKSAGDSPDGQQPEAEKKDE